MKNTPSFALFALTALFGVVSNSLHAETTRKVIQIRDAHYILEKVSSYGKLDQSLTIKTLDEKKIASLSCVIVMDERKKKIGWIGSLKTEEKFRHLGLAEQLIVEVSTIFYQNDVKDIQFIASPFGFESQNRNADMKRLVRYYLRMSEKYGLATRHHGINQTGTDMTCTLSQPPILLSEQHAKRLRRPASIYARPMISSRL